jgi:mannose-6-phosphate isomerase-like protein (cupin superfamily)
MTRQDDPSQGLADYNAPSSDVEITASLKWKPVKGGYEKFVESEGIPIFRGIGVRDTREMDLGEWARRDAKGAYLLLDGLDGLKGMYVMEIPPTKATAPEKKLYHEFFIVVEGRGTTEIWIEGDSASRQSFEWQAGSMFRIPPNVHYRMINASRQRALLINANNSPAIFNLFPHDFIFKNDFSFPEFQAGKKFYEFDSRVVANPYDKRAAIRANFYPDIANCELPYDNQRAPGYRRITTMWVGFENEPTGGFVGEYPIGRYSMGHSHWAGAVLVCLKGEGYTYNWPRELGFTPWKDGHEDEVRVVDYVAGGLVAAAPGGGLWYHQHFGVGTTPFRVCNFWGGPTPSTPKFIDEKTGMSALATTREGGWSIDYRDEDPFVRQEFARRLQAVGRSSEMPPEIYDENSAGKFRVVSM